MKKGLIVILLLVFLLVSCKDTVHVKVIPRSAEDIPSLNIIEPKEGEVINTGNVKIVFGVKNFQVGDLGNAINVIIDDAPRLTHATAEPFLVSSLSSGRHVIRAFAARNGESVKDAQAFAVRQFYVKNNATELLNLNLPMLMYNEPVGTYKGADSQRVLLDFLVSNIVLSEKGYKVVYKIDDVAHELTTVAPIYLTDLTSGKHTIMLELVDKKGALAEGNFVKTQHDIVIEK